MAEGGKCPHGRYAEAEDRSSVGSIVPLYYGTPNLNREKYDAFTALMADATVPPLLGGVCGRLTLVSLEPKCESVGVRSF